MPRVGFEPTISAGERPQTYALDRAATGTGVYKVTFLNLWLTESTAIGPTASCTTNHFLNREDAVHSRVLDPHLIVVNFYVL